MQRILPLIFAFLAIALAVLGIIIDLPLITKYFPNIIIFLFSVIIILIWVNDNNELKRDRDEEIVQKKMFDVLNRLTKAIVEIFSSDKYSNQYYEFRITTAKEKVRDLTWANFDINNITYSTKENYLDKIKQIAQKGITYEEIFIFNKGESLRKDRLAKLKFHYENAKNPKNRVYNYSCHYIDVPLNLNFPRIQFTLIDSDEIIFTSGYRDVKKFTVKNKELMSLFINYFEDAIDVSNKLIDNGIIVTENEGIINNLLRPLNDSEKNI